MNKRVTDKLWVTRPSLLGSTMNLNPHVEAARASGARSFWNSSESLLPPDSHPLPSRRDWTLWLAPHKQNTADVMGSHFQGQDAQGHAFPHAPPSLRLPLGLLWWTSCHFTASPTERSTWPGIEVLSAAAPETILPTGSVEDKTAASVRLWVRWPSWVAPWYRDLQKLWGDKYGVVSPWIGGN